MLDDSEEHRPYEDFAVRHVMGSLDEAESGAFRSHLLDCSECRARVGELRSIASDLAEVERTERRERAARQVETKEREDAAGEASGVAEAPPNRTVRLAVIAGILLIIVLSVWNFVLRGQNSGLEALVSDLRESAETINFGDPFEVERVASRHDAVARVADGQIAIMVRGTVDGAPYQINVYDANDSLLFTRAVESVDGRVRYFDGPFRAEVERVEIARNRGNGQTIIFRATTPDTPSTPDTP